MALHRFNPRLVKAHFSYLVAEAASLCGVHGNTIHRWIRSGLAICDDERPILILGADLQQFLLQMRAGRKQRCGPGQLFCFGCNAPRVPLGRLVSYRAKSAFNGSLSGRCAQCGTAMHQASSPRKLRETRLHFEVSFTSASPDIADTSEPVVNGDLKTGAN